MAAAQVDVGEYTASWWSGTVLQVAVVGTVAAAQGVRHTARQPEQEEG